MRKKKVSLTSKVQLRQALVLHAASVTTEVERLPVMGKGKSEAKQPTVVKPITQVMPPSPPSEAGSSEGSGELEHRKRQKIGKYFNSYDIVMNYEKDLCSIICYFAIVVEEEEEDIPQEGTSSEVSPVLEIFDSPPRMDKGKGLAIPDSSRLGEAVNIAAEAAK